MNDNIETVKAAYAAFGRGDIPGVLKLLSPEAEWTIAGPSNVVPYAGHHKGTAEISEYFAKLSAAEDMRKFEATSSSLRTTRSSCWGTTTHKSRQRAANSTTTGHKCFSSPTVGSPGSASSVTRLPRWRHSLPSPKTSVDRFALIGLRQNSSAVVGIFAS